MNGENGKRLRIALIYMPFAPPEGPAIGLTQIASVLKQRFGGQVDIRIHYLNLDVAALPDAAGFYGAATSPYGRMTGLADWFFRAAAFPDAEDNIEAYLGRYYYDGATEATEVAEFARARRGELFAFLDELIDRYALDSADLVGFSLCFFQTVASLAMASRLKLRNPEVTVVFGGPAVKGVPGKTLVEHAPCVDAVFSGPGLVSFPELVGRRLAGLPITRPAIPGVFARGVADALPPACNVGAQLDIRKDVPLDYRSFLDHFDAVLGDSGRQPFLLMQTSRGCWWADRRRCTFCGLNDLQERFEALPPEAALRHIRSVLGYAGRVSRFVACDNVVPPNYFREVFPHLAPPQGVFIKYETRSAITAEEIRVLCRAGIRCVQPGVEALSTESLTLMRKGVTASDNLRFLKDCLRHALYVEWNLLLFSPGEREEVYRKYERDIPRLVHLQPPEGVFPIEFVRDSRYFEEAGAYGLDLEPHESLRYIYPFAPETLFGLCYRFTDRNADPVWAEQWLDRLGGLIETWQERWACGPEERPFLLLYRDAQSACIHDSRSGGTGRYRISDLSERLLQEMGETPRTISEAAVAAEVEENAVRREIGFLNERQLLFEEDGRFLSLVISPT